MSDALSKPDQSHDEAMAKVMKLIAGNKICMLTTRDENGELLSRPMAMDEKGFDGTLWFVCHDDTRKVEHVRHDPRVNVSFHLEASGCRSTGALRSSRTLQS